MYGLQSEIYDLTQTHRYPHIQVDSNNYGIKKYTQSTEAIYSVIYVRTICFIGLALIYLVTVMYTPNIHWNLGVMKEHMLLIRSHAYLCLSAIIEEKRTQVSMYWYFQVHDGLMNTILLTNMK